VPSIRVLLGGPFASFFMGFWPGQVMPHHTGAELDGPFGSQHGGQLRRCVRDKAQTLRRVVDKVARSNWTWAGAVP